MTGGARDTFRDSMELLRPNRRLLLALLVLAAALLLVTAPVFMLAMAPAIALFAMVAHRVMPGEDLIVRLRSATRRAAAAPPPPPAARTTSSSCAAPAG